MRKPIRIWSTLTDEAVAAIEGKMVGEGYCKTIIGGENRDVLKPDGSPLLKLRTKAITEEAADRAYPALWKAGSRWNHNREVTSNIVGYFDYCDGPGTPGPTAFTRHHPQDYLACIPFIREVNLVYQRHYRKRWSAQRKIARNTKPEFVIGRTAFTTMTVNLWDETHDARMYLHADDGDLPEGFGVITTLTAGDHCGGLLVFPKYQVGVDLRDRDVLLCDVHEMHGNTAIVGEPGWERISCVLYYRTKMQYC